MNIVPGTGDMVMLVTGNDLSDLERDIFITSKYSRSHQPLCKIFFFLIPAFHFLELHFIIISLIDKGGKCWFFLFIE